MYPTDIIFSFGLYEEKIGVNGSQLLVKLVPKTCHKKFISLKNFSVEGLIKMRFSENTSEK
jgi:hypothetical protein